MADKEQEVETRRSELEALKQEKETHARALAEREASVTRLGQELAGKDNEMTTLRQAAAESERKLAEANSTLVQAVASYRELVTKTNPGIPVEMVGGDSIEAINRSLENACALVEKVKQGIEAETSRTRVPAGAPQRKPSDLSALSAREKIQYGIGGKR